MTEVISATLLTTTRWRRLIIIGQLFMVGLPPLLASAACAATVDVAIHHTAFAPNPVNINVGDTVRWTAMEPDHTVTADDGSFDSSTPQNFTLPLSATFSHTFNSAGAFRYFCQIHGGPNGQGMAGTVNVGTAESSLVVTNPRAFLEGSAGTPGFTTFNVLLSAPSNQTVSVAFRTADGTAKAGVDYLSKSGTLTFTPGQTRKSVVVNFIGDAIAELNETCFLDLRTPVNATIADSRGSAYIGNDDGPSIVIDNARAVFEGNSGTTLQNFTVRLSAASTNSITVDFITANGTAGPADYTATSGRLTFASGEISKMIMVQVKGDATVESTETYRVNLTRSTFAIIADSQGVGYIANDDGTSGSVIPDEPSQ